ncbi:MAG: DUF1343 domain-containing protein [Victivallales bacterium]|nr:DUF1343 domain-containing protein [Victivallales bacterium]
MVKNGIDTISEYRKLFKNKRIGLITNHSGVDSSFNSSAKILHESVGLAALFGPEHGVNGNYQAGDHVADAINPVWGVPEYSLFGSTPRLTPEMLGKGDIIAFDAQDIGSRFFTYIYTLSDALEDCAAAGIPVVVFDRPNPIGGMQTEGTMLRKEYASFIGRYPLPARHGLTAGEFARYINDRFKIGCDLTVIPCKNWKRDLFFDDYNASWLNPSPNMPSMTAALVYNGTCFFEGTNVSEGRGTTRPYEIICAPFLDAAPICRRLNQLRLPGVIYRNLYIIPFSSKYRYNGELCQGIQIHVTDKSAFNGFECGIRLFCAIREMTPLFKCCRSDHLDHLFGDDALRRGREDVESLIARGREESCTFAAGTAVQYYLYQ